MPDIASRLADYLHDRRAAILDAWRALAEQDPALSTTTRFTREQFNDHVPSALDALDRELRHVPGAPGANAAVEHGSHRWQQGCGLGELVREFGHLHISLIRAVEAFIRAEPAADTGAVARVLEVIARLIHDGVTASVSRYHELQQAEAAGRVRALESALAEFGDGEKARGEALRAASHDLRGGLQMVAMSAAVLDAQGLPDEARQQSVRRLQGGLSALRSMLNAMADLSRLEAGHERRVLGRFDAARTLSDLCAAARPMAEERGLYLRAEGPADLPVEGDEGRVQRIAQNLLINALKYTPAGGVIVRWEDHSPEVWRFSVSDTGPGIETGSRASLATELKAVTQTARAVEGDDSPPPAPPPAPGRQSRPPEAGEGIGLSIVKRLCELLDAGIELDSKQGQGSTFRITLPRRYDETPP